MIDLKTRAVARFFPDECTFHNIYKLQKHVLLRHESYLIVFMGNNNLQLLYNNFLVQTFVFLSIQYVIHVYILSPCVVVHRDH